MLLVASAPALAAPAPRPAIGLQDDYLSSARPDEVGPRLDLIERSRAGVSRVDVLWRDVARTRPANPTDPADPAYDWRRIDAIVTGLAERDVRAILTAYSSPAWTTTRDAPDGSGVNPGLPVVRDYADFMQALATRYNGYFTPAGARRPLPEVRHIEIWNEPNLARFLEPQWVAGRPVAQMHYVAMLRMAFPRIKRANPDAVVIAGASGPRSSTGEGGIGAMDWLRGILAARVRFDAYSLHVYPAVGPKKGTRGFPAWSTLRFAIKEIDRRPAHRGKPLYITEAGWTTLPTPLRKVVVSEGEQALNLFAVPRTKVARSGRIAAIVWFNLQDNPDWPGGLLRGDLSRKPAWGAFRMVAAKGGALPGLRRSPAVVSRERRLRVDRRTAQEALRRAALVEARLGALTGDDIRPGGLTPESFDSSVALAGAPGGEGSRPMSRRLPLPLSATAAPGAGAADAGARARANLRLAMTASAWADALERRLDQGLTGGDIADNTIRTDRLAHGYRLAGTAASAGVQPATLTRVPALAVEAGAVRATPARLAATQAIAQDALLRMKRLTRILERGLTSDHFRPGSITAADLREGARD